MTSENEETDEVSIEREDAQTQPSRAGSNGSEIQSTETVTNIHRIDGSASVSEEEAPSTSTNITSTLKEESDSDAIEEPESDIRNEDSERNLTELSTTTTSGPHRVRMLPRVNTNDIVPITENSNMETPYNEGINDLAPRTLGQADTDNFFSSLTPTPSALVSTTFPANTVFKSSLASKLSGGQIVCGIIQLVCGFGISEGVDGTYLPFYLRSAMPIWTGAIYLMTAITGSVAVNSKRQLAIIIFAVFSLISLGLSIALSALIAPDVTGYATVSCYNASAQEDTSKTETGALKCNEARLVTVLAAISLAFGLIDAIISFVSAVVSGQALFRCCSKPDVNVFQEAPVFFRTGPRGDVQANIITGNHRPPVVVPLPDYNDVVAGTALPSTTNQPSSSPDLLDVNALPVPPRTPPPAYRRSISEESNHNSDEDNLT